MATPAPGSAQANANAAAQALYDASGGKISQTQLAIMTAIAGQQSNWNDTVVQGGGPANGAANIGVGLWQITPGTSADQTAAGNAQAAWAKFNSGLAAGNPYAAWNLTANGTSQLYATATNPDGSTSPASGPPSQADYVAGWAASNAVYGKPMPTNTPEGAAVVAAATAASGNQAAIAAAGGTSSIMGNCDGKKHYINFPSVAGIGGGGLLTQCNVKALLSFMLIASGSLLGLAGALLLFDRSGKLLGKSTGRTAQLAGAGIGAVPGGQAVGSAVMWAGHKVSKASGSKAPARQTPRQRSDNEQAIYAQGVAAGQPRSQPVRPRQNSGPGSRYADVAGAF